MKTLKIFLCGLTLLCLLPSELKAQKQSAFLKGVVTDAANGETIPFANIVLKDSKGQIVAGGTSDIDGLFHINPLEPDTYSIEVHFTGYTTEKFHKVGIRAGENTLYAFLEANEDFRDVIVCYILCCVADDSAQEDLDADEEEIINPMLSHPLLSSLPEDGIALFPNPTAGRFQLAFAEAMDGIYIQNSSGQLIWRGTANKYELIEMDFSSFAKETYYISYKLDGQWATKPIVVH